MYVRFFVEKIGNCEFWQIQIRFLFLQELTFQIYEEKAKKNIFFRLQIFRRVNWHVCIFWDKFEVLLCPLLRGNSCLHTSVFLVQLTLCFACGSTAAAAAATAQVDKIHFQTSEKLSGHVDRILRRDTDSDGLNSIRKGVDCTYAVTYFLLSTSFIDRQSVIDRRS